MTNQATQAPGFGIEIECFLPDGRTGIQAANALAAAGIPCFFESYNHRTAPHWKVVTDGSLGDYTRGIEFVSPVLYGADGLAQVEKVCTALKAFGCTVNKKCGLHVHVGVRGAPLAFFKNLAKLYATYEPVIDGMMPNSRRASHNMFCRSMTALNPRTLETADSFDAVLRAVNGVGHESRYFKLNLSAYRRHSTVEFRQHSGTLEGDKAIKWTALCLKMVATAMKADCAITATSSRNRARAGSKSRLIGDMMMRPEGVTAREAMTAAGWPSVSLPQQAGICGLAYTTQRTGREVRYFAVTAQTGNDINVDTYATLIDATADEKAYMHERTRTLAGRSLAA